MVKKQKGGSEPVKGDYLVVVPTPHFGEIVLVFSNNGASLEWGRLASEETEGFYAAVGIKQHDGAAVRAEAGILELEPSFQVPVGVNDRSISDVVEELYTLAKDFKAEQSKFAKKFYVATFALGVLTSSYYLIVNHVINRILAGVQVASIDAADFVAIAGLIFPLAYGEYVTGLRTHRSELRQKRFELGEHVRVAILRSDILPGGYGRSSG